MRLSHIKKFILLLGAASTISFFSITNSHAQGAVEVLLQQIAQNTYNILQNVNNLPAYLATSGQLILAWLSPDNSSATASLQQSFSQLGLVLNQDLQAQLSLQPQLNATLLGPSANKTNLYYANDLVYSTLLGEPVFSPDPRSQANKNAKVNAVFNYIKNASAINIQHMIPVPSWQGTQENQTIYQNYYDTVLTISSFNGYALSNLYSQGNQLNTLQTSLISQATNSKTWFAQVASENIGIVLRQILLFESQTFVLLSQLVQTQQQLLTAQVMTNTLLISANQPAEDLMVSRARGLRQQ